MFNEFFKKATDTMADADLATVGKIAGGVLVGAGVIALIGAGIHHAKTQQPDDVADEQPEVEEVEEVETPVEVVENN